RSFASRARPDSHRYRCRRPVVLLAISPWPRASSEQMLDLEFLASDSGGFVPVYFSNVNRAIGKANACDAFALAPATEAIDPPQARDLADRGAGSESLDPGNFAQNLEAHPLIVSIADHTVNIAILRQRKSRSPLDRLRPARDRGDAGSRHLHQPNGAHELDEIVDLAWGAGQFENEALGGRVDHLGAEGVGEPHRLDPILALASHLDHRKLPLDRAHGERQIVHRMDRNQPLELMTDLLDDLRRARSDDGDAREMRRVRDLGDGQALDVVAAPREHADDACEHPRLVVDQHR